MPKLVVEKLTQTLCTNSTLHTASLVYPTFICVINSFLNRLIHSLTHRNITRFVSVVGALLHTFHRAYYGYYLFIYRIHTNTGGVKI
jgi:hypothetical protein